MQQSYKQGFMDKCAALGVDPAALLKKSQDQIAGSNYPADLGKYLGTKGTYLADGVTNIPSSKQKVDLTKTPAGFSIANRGRAKTLAPPTK